jgi:hypothetical protein
MKHDQGMEVQLLFPGGYDQIIPEALKIPTTPTSIQKRLSKEYATSFFRIAHHDNRTASVVLNIQTNMNGLREPSQLTSEKLNILITTPIISITLTLFKINLLSFFKITHRDAFISSTMLGKIFAKINCDHLGPKSFLRKHYR